MVIEQTPSYRQEPLSNAEQVDQYFDQLLRVNQDNYNSYTVSNEHRSSWFQWHRLRRSWFHHSLTVHAITGSRSKVQSRVTDEELHIYDQHPLKTAFLIAPNENISQLKDKSPRALIKFARKTPVQVLAERLR
jgi:hypothetical protein